MGYAGQANCARIPLPGELPEEKLGAPSPLIGPFLGGLHLSCTRARNVDPSRCLRPPFFSNLADSVQSFLDLFVHLLSLIVWKLSSLSIFPAEVISISFHWLRVSTRRPVEAATPPSNSLAALD